MKVAVLTFACDAGRSGIGQYVIHLLREFSQCRSGLELEVIGLPDELDLFLPDGHPFSVYRVSSRWKSPILNILWQNIILPLVCRTRGYDVVFLPAANRRLPVWLPCRSVGTVHDFSSMHIHGKYDPLRDVYIKRVLPFLVRQLTHVIAVSECTKVDIVKFARVEDERIAVIPHGVDFDVYAPRNKPASQSSVCDRYSIRAPYVLYISRIEHPGKNHVRLIRAFAEVKAKTNLPHQLVLAGSDWNRADEVHRVADASGLGDEILFTGYVDGVDLPDLYCGADLFVFPSLFEGFGMPILEAMACGVPVACSDISSLPEVAGDAAVYFDPSDESSIANVLKDMLTRPDVRNRYAEAGKQRAAGFSWSAAGESTLRAITAVSSVP